MVYNNNSPLDTSGISGPAETHHYQDYEIPLEARENMKEIERCLKKGLYKDEHMIREHIDLLENLDADITTALSNETRLGRTNVTAKHDLEHARKLLKQLEEELSKFP
jgi:hypothetical protein